MGRRLKLPLVLSLLITACVPISNSQTPATSSGALHVSCAPLARHCLKYELRLQDDPDRGGVRFELTGSALQGVTATTTFSEGCQQESLNTAFCPYGLEAQAAIVAEKGDGRRLQAAFFSGPLTDEARPAPGGMQSLLLLHEKATTTRAPAEQSPLSALCYRAGPDVDFYDGHAVELARFSACNAQD